MGERVGKAAARSLARFIKTTLTGGVLFLVPVVGLGVMVFAALRGAKWLAQPLIARAPRYSVLSVLIADLLVLAALVLVCFLAGLLARRSVRSRLFERADATVLWRIPGYAFVKGMAESLESGGRSTSMRTVLVQFQDHSQLAFEVDALSDGRRIIYLPNAPNPRDGSVVVVEAQQVAETTLTPWATLATLRALGHGSARLFERIPAPPPPPSRL